MAAGDTSASTTEIATSGARKKLRNNASRSASAVSAARRVEMSVKTPTAIVTAPFSYTGDALTET
jgi:hypothetical protein